MKSENNNEESQKLSKLEPSMRFFIFKDLIVHIAIQSLL
jgi:hypothetical protein